MTDGTQSISRGVEEQDKFEKLTKEKRPKEI
jgi:hypothetical protein